MHVGAAVHCVPMFLGEAGQIVLYIFGPMLQSLSKREAFNILVKAYYFQFRVTLSVAHAHSAAQSEASINDYVYS